MGGHVRGEDARRGGFHRAAARLPSLSNLHHALGLHELVGLPAWDDAARVVACVVRRVATNHHWKGELRAWP